LPYDLKITSTSLHYTDFSVYKITFQNLSERLTLAESPRFAVSDLRENALSTLRVKSFRSDGVAYDETNYANVKSTPMLSLKIPFTVHNVFVPSRNAVGKFAEVRGKTRVLATIDDT
jgi:hypothetical protein